MTEIARVKLEEKEKYQKEVQNIRKQVYVTVRGIMYTMFSISKPERDSNFWHCANGNEL